MERILDLMAWSTAENVLPWPHELAKQKWYLSQTAGHDVGIAATVDHRLTFLGEPQTRTREQKRYRAGLAKRLGLGRWASDQDLRARVIENYLFYDGILKQDIEEGATPLEGELRRYWRRTHGRDFTDFNLNQVAVYEFCMNYGLPRTTYGRMLESLGVQR